MTIHRSHGQGPGHEAPGEAVARSQGTAAGTGPYDVAAAYRAAKPALMRVAHRLTETSADAEDLVAEAFTRTLEVMRSRGEPIENLPGYVTRVMQTLQYKSWERRRRIRIEPGDVERALNMQPDESPEGNPDGVSTALQVREALASLPPLWREVLWYSEVEGMGPTELARELQISRSNASVLAFRARQGLRAAYLSGELPEGASPKCAAFNADIAAQAMGRLGSRGQQRLSEHLGGCATCQARVEQAQSLLSTMEAAMLPALATLGAVGAGVGTRAGLLAGWSLSIKHVVAVASALAVIGGGVGLFLALRPEPALAELAPAPSVTAIATPGSSPTSAPTSPPITPAAVVAVPTQQPTFDPLPPSVAPTTVAPVEPTASPATAASSPVSLPEPVVAESPLMLVVDVSQAATTGRVGVSVGALVSGDSLRAVVTVPGGMGVASASGWACSGSRAVVCTASGASSGQFSLTLATVGSGSAGGADSSGSAGGEPGAAGGSAVSGSLQIAVTVTHDPTHISQSNLTTPVTIPAP